MSRFFLFSFALHLVLFVMTLNFKSTDFSNDVVEIEISKFTPQIVKSVSPKRELLPSVPTESTNTQEAASGKITGDAQAQYLSQIHELVRRQQTYPPLSKQLKEQGLVRLQLTIASSGSLQKVELLEASPFKRLNDAAMKAVTRAAPFQPFPLEMTSAFWKITIPVKFTLN